MVSGHLNYFILLPRFSTVCVCLILNSFVFAQSLPTLIRHKTTQVLFDVCAKSGLDFEHSTGFLIEIQKVVILEHSTRFLMGISKVFILGFLPNDLVQNNETPDARYQIKN